MNAAIQLSMTLLVLLALLAVGYLVPLFRHGLTTGWNAVQTWAVGAFEWVSRGLHGLDSALIWTSRPFFTQCPHAFLRWGVFLLWYAGLYAVVYAAPPLIGLVVLGWGLWGVLAINRAWVRNEKTRSKIAKKIDPAVADADPLASHDVGNPEVVDGPPADDHAPAIGWVKDSYAPTPPAGSDQAAGLANRMLLVLRRTPDLRLMAFFASLQLLALIPMLLVVVHQLFGAFQLQSDASGASQWAGEVTIAQSLWFILDTTYLKAVVDWLRPDLHTSVTLVSGIAWVIPVIKLAVYVLLTLGIFRLLQIVEDIKEGILGARQDPDMAVLLGQRAVPRLLAKLDDPKVPSLVRENILLALGRLRDLRAADVLHRLANDTTQSARLRAAATLALGYLASPLVPTPEPSPVKPPPDPLAAPAAKKTHPAPDDRRRAATKRVADELAHLLRHDKCDIVREAAAIGLGMTDHPDAPAALLDRLNQIQHAKDGGRAVEALPEVVKHLAQSVGERLGTGWSAVAGEPADPQLVTTAVKLFLDYESRKEKSGVARDRTQGAHSLLRHRYLRVRNRSVRALGALGETELALPALLAVMNDNDNPKLLDVWAEVVGRLTAKLPADSPTRGRAVDELTRLLDRLKNSTVQGSAARALGAMAKAHLDAVTRKAEATLLAALKDAYLLDDKEVQDSLAIVLAGPFRAWDRADQVRREYSFEFLADQVDLVCGEADLTARVAAAKLIRPLKDDGSLARLDRLLANPTLPPELRTELTPTVEAMRKVVGVSGG